VVADITGKPQGLSGIKECLTLEVYIDMVLIEKVLQFQLPAVQPICIPAGKAQGFSLFRPRACCHIQPQIGMVFRTARRWVTTIGREEMDVSSR